MGYLNKISSLEKRASVEVAFNLCEKNDFKEVAMGLKKPMYGAFINACGSSTVVSALEKSSRSFRIKVAKLWFAAVNEQCQRLTEGLPHFLKHGVHAWINRIAWEYLSYTRRQEVLFGISRYFLMDVLTRGDWTEDCRLDEKKLAERLLKDQRLTVLQRYRIACVYCLHENIPQFWKRLTRKEKQSISGNDDPSLSQESHSLVLLWSYQMDGHREEKVIRRSDPEINRVQQSSDPAIYAVQQAICYGNRVGLLSCWKSLGKHTRQHIVIDMALLSLRTCRYHPGDVALELLWDKLPREQSPIEMKVFNLPSYHSGLVLFFLAQMDEEQQLTFFQKVRDDLFYDVLKCFLDRSYQNDFLPTITHRLLGIMPKDNYASCLLASSAQFTEDYEEEHLYYDSHSLLWTLWEEAPEEYKRYVFLDKMGSLAAGKLVLIRFLARSSFQEKAEALFKRILSDLPQEEKRAIILSGEGGYICRKLMASKRFTFMNCLLEECLKKEEIPSFKKQVQDIL